MTLRELLKDGPIEYHVDQEAWRIRLNGYSDPIREFRTMHGDWVVIQSRLSVGGPHVDAVIAAATKTLRLQFERILSLGHNDECVFCGFKDKQACIALGKDPAAVSEEMRG